MTDDVPSSWRSSNCSSLIPKLLDADATRNTLPWRTDPAAGFSSAVVGGVRFTGRACFAYEEISAVEKSER
jgi:hypothetical protein